MDTEAQQPRRQLSAEHRARISEALTGREVSDETRAKLSKANKGRPGRPLSPQHRARLSEVRKGREKSPQHRARISEGLKGLAVSDETRAKLSKALKGRPARPFSPQHRARISEALRQREISPETRAKMAETMRGRRVIPKDLADQFEAFLDRRRAARPKSATSPATPRPAVEIGAVDEPVYLRGASMGVVRPSQHRALKILSEVYPGGMTLKELGRAYSGTGGDGARGALRALRRSDPAWLSAFGFPVSGGD